MKKTILFILLSVFISGYLTGKEGMWIPSLLKKYNIEEMQKMGFRLTAEDIYDVNHASMKDAVVHFGGGCTGELISGDGLLITNYHCGYDQIQSHSSLTHDYLKDGFWAKNRTEELPCPGLSVSILEYMEDVTAKVLEGTDTITLSKLRTRKISDNIRAIEKEAQKNGKFQAQVRPLFYGNQYFLNVHKVYNDVRLVGAPPSSIGKFGGDTDNWVWPRHTGDFSLFRIYANPENEPARYSSENIPFKPEKFFTLCMKGIQPGDFTMVFGYPGRTTSYITSDAVKLLISQRDPDRIGIRDIKLNILSSFMNSDREMGIKYAVKYADISNSWKKWQGEVMGLEKKDAVRKIEIRESEFEKWAKSNNLWESRYSPIFSQSGNIYAKYAPFAKATDHYNEIVNNGIEIFLLAGRMREYQKTLKDDLEVDTLGRNSIIKWINNFFGEYHQPLDEQLFLQLLPMLAEKVDKDLLPGSFIALTAKNSPDELLEKLYRKSILSDSLKLKKLLKQKNRTVKRVLSKDPVMLLFGDLRNHFETNIQPQTRKLEAEMDEFMKIYMEGIMQMNRDKPLYPDANGTLRVSYGKVEGYQPRDGVSYLYSSTLSGVIEKDSPQISDYNVPDRLKELYLQKDFGQYGENGKLPVCFVASNHTSGGNSGSPVVNADGQLIGINFDRCWEGTMSDIWYDPDICRNIILDIRYVLFIIDKFAQSDYLLKEMKISR